MANVICRQCQRRVAELILTSSIENLSRFWLFPMLTVGAPEVAASDEEWESVSGGRDDASILKLAARQPDKIRLETHGSLAVVYREMGDIEGSLREAGTFLSQSRSPSRLRTAVLNGLFGVGALNEHGLTLLKNVLGY